MGAVLTAPYIGTDCALGCLLDALPWDRLLDAPWLAPWIALRWGGPGGNRAWGLFLGTSSFCITGKKIPNVVGFGTFPNVVGLPSLQTVPRIEAALHGGLNCAVYGGGLDCALYRNRLRVGLPLGRLALGSPLGCALACSLDCFALGRALGESSLGPFFGNVVVLHNGKEDS